MTVTEWQEKHASRWRELSALPKHELIRMHRANGGLLSAAEYATWSRQELVTEVLGAEEAREGARSAGPCVAPGA